MHAASQWLPSVRRRSLVACIAATLAFSVFTPSDLRARPARHAPAMNAPATPAGTVIVTNCDDAGPGSLRDAVANAASGETIDLTQLACSTITLTTGAIDVPLDDLSVTGPGAATLTVNGSNLDRVFTHDGSGTLRIGGLTLTNGFNGLPAAYGAGGCVYSIGSVAVYDSAIYRCSASGTSYGLGGGIYAYGNVTIVGSAVNECVAEGYVADGGGIFVVGNAYLTDARFTDDAAQGTGFASGGAVFVILGSLTMEYSTLAYNVAYATSAGGFSLGGAIHSFGDVTIQDSAITGNAADNVAGLVLEAYQNAPAATIVNSTISGNGNSSTVFGAIYTAIPLGIYNSTIASNTGRSAGGVDAFGPAVTLESSIIATNGGQDLLLAHGATVRGSHDLIEVATTVPPGTLRSDPLLAALADNGGPTKTRALQAGSPAIDAGSNRMSLATDQRGDGFPRTGGAAPDIGAFESVFSDRIFADGFDGGPFRSAH